MEQVGLVVARTTVTKPAAPAAQIGEVDLTPVRSRPTGIGELDRVLGGGIIPGSVTLLSGEPGVGKSTLLLEVGARAARAGQRVLYVTAEETAAQVRLRAERTGTVAPGLLLAAETDLATVLGHLEQAGPDLLILDSVQTVASAQVEGQPGNVAQVREVAACVVRACKASGAAAVLVGHVTKDGGIAGPRTLEHLVDVVCQFEGEPGTRLRVLRAVKNRFGPTDEMGCFDLSEGGIVEVADPGGLFLSRQDLSAPGTCVTVDLRGRRPMVVEVQALVSTARGAPRRTTQGLDSSRVAMVQAVLDRRLRLPLEGLDVFVSTVGGAELREPSSDLAVALALASAVMDVPLPARLVAFGEIGLTGEVRQVAGLGRRLAEAARLGYQTAVVPRGGLDQVRVPATLQVHELGQTVEAVHRGLLKAVT